MLGSRVVKQLIDALEYSTLVTIRTGQGPREPTFSLVTRLRSECIDETRLDINVRKVHRACRILTFRSFVAHLDVEIAE